MRHGGRGLRDRWLERQDGRDDDTLLRSFGLRPRSEVRPAPGSRSVPGRDDRTAEGSLWPLRSRRRGGLRRKRHRNRLLPLVRHEISADRGSRLARLPPSGASAWGTTLEDQLENARFVAKRIAKGEATRSSAFDKSGGRSRIARETGGTGGPTSASLSGGSGPFSPRQRRCFSAGS